MISSIPSRPDPLGFMIHLTQSTYLFQPKSFTPTSPTIVLLTWMNAVPTHIAFYLQAYRKLYPTARLQLIRGTIPDMIYVSTSTQKRSLAPALSILRAEPDSAIFLHLFSNSGAHSAATLLRAYRDDCSMNRDDKTETIMPVKGLFLDSAPSLGDYSSGYAGMSYEVRRLPIWMQPVGLLSVHLLVGMFWLFHRLIRLPNVLTRSYDDLLDSGLVDGKAPRVYFYSKADRLVRHDHILKHARAAESRGRRVQTVEFDGTAHCKHGKGVGEEKYWAVVEDLIQGAEVPKAV